MKAFIAVMLVAAVSGQMTYGVDRNIMDLLRTRQVLNRGMTVPTYYNQVGQQMGGVYGDLTTGQFLPSTQQFNIPSELNVYKTNSFTTLYTLRQLYTLPIFQEYMTLPLFRQYLNVPAFQQYLVSQYFQQYFTQTTFRQFFVEPALFYKYIFPVVLQYQQQIGTTTYGYETLTVPEVYVKYVPEIYRGLIPAITRDVVPEVFRGIVPTVYTDNTNTYTYGKRVFPSIYNTNTVGQTVFGMGYNKNIVPEMYNKNIVPEIYNKNIVPEVYNTEMYGNGYNTIKNVLNTEELTRKVLFPQVYGFGKNVYNKNFNLYNKQTVTPFTTGYETVVPMTYNTNTFVPKTTETLLLEKIFKDLVEGKINIEDLKVNTEGQLLGEKLNKIVDPITGDFKIVEGKVVKPIVEGQFNKEALLNKVILQKQIFNKL